MGLNLATLADPSGASELHGIAADALKHAATPAAATQPSTRPTTAPSSVVAVDSEITSIADGLRAQNYKLEPTKDGQGWQATSPTGVVIEFGKLPSNDPSKQDWFIRQSEPAANVQITTSSENGATVSSLTFAGKSEPSMTIMGSISLFATSGQGLYFGAVPEFQRGHPNRGNRYDQVLIPLEFKDRVYPLLNPVINFHPSIPSTINVNTKIDCKIDNKVNDVLDPFSIVGTRISGAGKLGKVQFR